MNAVDESESPDSGDEDVVASSSSDADEDTRSEQRDASSRAAVGENAVVV